MLRNASFHKIAPAHSFTVVLQQNYSRSTFDFTPVSHRSFLVAMVKKLIKLINKIWWKWQFFETWCIK